MKTKIFFISILLVSGVTGKTAASDAAGFPEISGWELNVSPDVYVPENLWDLINGGAESYLSYDFLDLHLAEYKNGEGILVHAEIYRHSSCNNAFGIYSTERSPEYKFLPVGIQGYTDTGILNFFSGQYYIKIYSTAYGEQVQQALIEVAKAISGHLGQDNSWPAELSAFPGEGKLKNRDHFVKENFIGFEFLRNAFIDEYEDGYRLFVIAGDDEGDIMDMLKAYLDFTGQNEGLAAETSFIIKDRYNGDIPVMVRGKYLAGILDGEDNAGAKKNLEALVKNLD